MSLTRLFVARPTLVFVLVALMTFAGVVSTKTIVKQLFPDTSQPTITISVQYNGASVSEMRDSIVSPIEQALSGTTDLQTIQSVVQQGQAQISAIFYLGSDQATDLALTQKAIQASLKNLPTNITPPVASIRDPSESTVLTLAMYSDKFSAGQLSLYADNVIIPRIQQIPGISYASVGGDVTPAYEVLIDPAKLAASGLTINDVMNTVSADNNRVPGGIAYEPNRETVVDVRGDIQDLNSVRRLAITGAPSSTAPSDTAGAVNDPLAGLAGAAGTVNPWTATDSVRRIADVASVIAGYEPRRQYAQIDGRPGLFVQIQKTSDASEVDSAQNVMKQLPSIERQYPGIEFKVINTQSVFTEQQIEIVTKTLMESILLTGLAMVFFLRSWRSAIVVCVAIPTSLAIAITVIKILGMTLDIISLLAMSLVIGILVDDSTVVLENIERHFRELHQPPEKAAIDGREEIGAAAVVITMVDVVVFLPIAFISGQVGRFLFEFAIVVVVSTLTSLFVSFTVTPTLAGLWALRSHWKAPKIVDWFTSFFDGVRDLYAHRILPWAMRHGVLIASLCGLSFVLSVAAVPLGFVGETFVPSTDRGQIYLQLVYPIGTPLQHVRDGVYRVEAEVNKLKDVAAEGTSAGAYSASFGGFVIQGNVAQITIFLKDSRKYSTEQWVPRLAKLAKKYAPGADSVAVPSTGTSGGNKQPVDMLVSDVHGGDPTAYAQKVLELLKNTPGAVSVNSSGTLLAPTISIQFDREKAQALDVDLGVAANAAGAAFGGDVATQFETQQGLEQVQVIYPLEDQHTLDALRDIPIRANNGSIVHLGDFTTFTTTPTSPLVTRVDRNNVVHINANFGPGSSLSSVQRAFFAKLPSLHLPPNIQVAVAPLGQQDFMNQTLAGMGGSLVYSVILVFLLMVALYNSYRSPFIILFSVPVAAVGAIGALIVTRQTLNLFSLIGVMLLIGIATKNGILLVDYANTLRRRGKAKLEAIRESAFTRFRPIVMTSFSVVAGNVPLALALDPGSNARASLGIVVIGGVLSSLVLTLLLVPTAYMWIAPNDVVHPQQPSPDGHVTVQPLAAEPVGAPA